MMAIVHRSNMDLSCMDCEEGMNPAFTTNLFHFYLMLHSFDACLNLERFARTVDKHCY
jgi:hypothetical protein